MECIQRRFLCREDGEASDLRLQRPRRGAQEGGQRNALHQPRKGPGIRYTEQIANKGSDMLQPS